MNSDPEGTQLVKVIGL